MPWPGHANVPVFIKFCLAIIKCCLAIKIAGKPKSTKMLKSLF
jgi:hypothetical protein